MADEIQALTDAIADDAEAKLLSEDDLRALIRAVPEGSINEFDESGYTPLQVACMENHWRAARLLTQERTDLDPAARGNPKLPARFNRLPIELALDAAANSQGKKQPDAYEPYFSLLDLNKSLLSKDDSLGDDVAQFLLEKLEDYPFQYVALIAAHPELYPGIVKAFKQKERLPRDFTTSEKMAAIIIKNYFPDDHSQPACLEALDMVLARPDVRPARLLKMVSQRLEFMESRNESMPEEELYAPLHALIGRLVKQPSYRAGDAVPAIMEILEHVHTTDAWSFIQPMLEQPSAQYMTSEQLQPLFRQVMLQFAERDEPMYNRQANERLFDWLLAHPRFAIDADHVLAYMKLGEAEDCERAERLVGHPGFQRPADWEQKVANHLVAIASAGDYDAEGNNLGDLRTALLRAPEPEPDRILRELDSAKARLAAGNDNVRDYLHKRQHGFEADRLNDLRFKRLRSLIFHCIEEMRTREPDTVPPMLLTAGFLNELSALTGCDVRFVTHDDNPDIAILSTFHDDEVLPRRKAKTLFEAAGCIALLGGQLVSWDEGGNPVFEVNTSQRLGERIAQILRPEAQQAAETDAPVTADRQAQEAARDSWQRRNEQRSIAERFGEIESQSPFRDNAPEVERDHRESYAGALHAMERTFTDPSHLNHLIFQRDPDQPRVAAPAQYR